jgi:hypothetical protein
MQVRGVWPMNPLTDPQPFSSTIAAVPEIASSGTKIIRPIRS